MLAALLLTLAQTPPDVLLIVLDDVGWQDMLRVRNAGWLPNMTQLAVDGFVCANASSCPICEPSRRTMYWGDFYARENGTSCSTSGGAPPPSSLTSIAEVLGGAGYDCGFLGKWHVGPPPNGASWRTAPQYWGFRLADWLPTYVKECSGTGYHNWRYVVGAVDQATSATYQPTKMLADFQAVWPALASPRFAIYSAQLAHEPWHVPDSSQLPAGYPIPTTDREKADAMIASLDYQVGLLLATVVDRDNTVICVVGDNGTPESVAIDPTHAKTHTFQEGVHVPLSFTGPGVPGGISYALVSITDIYATLADLAGASAFVPAGVDSASLVPLMSGAVTKVHDYIAFGIQDSSQNSGPNAIRDDVAARSLRYKFRRTRDDASQPWVEEFYDLALDPGEATNLIAVPAQATRIAQHRAFLVASLP